MTSSVLRCVLVVLMFWPVTMACSGRTEPDSQQGSAGGAGGLPGSESTAGKPADDPANFACPTDETCEPLGERDEVLPKPDCPGADPMEGTSCDTEELVCSYGTSVTAYCRRYYRCHVGAWTSQYNRQVTCISQPAEFCPGTPTQGGACVVGEVDVFVPCEYSGGVTCYCLGNPVGQKGAAGTWECYAPPRNAACPESLPNLGDGCRRDGQACHYGIVQQGCYAPYSDVYCFRGAWALSPAVCPL
jgi:hypothetical protein